MKSTDWHYISADKYCSKVTDGTHDTPKKSDHGKYLITSKHIKGSQVDFESAYFISEDDFHEINKRSRVDQWDVIISMIGAYCGFCFIESNPNVDYAVKNVGLFKTGDKLEAQWLYYYLNSHIGKAHLDSIKSGSSQPYITLGGIRNLPVLVPIKQEIKINIVNILSCIDAKIELNNRINAELEAMAKTLYDYWFEQIDFPFDFALGKPAANGKPYKSSGGKMVYNSTLKREIPEGWDVTKLKNIAETGSGGTPLRSINEYYENGNIPWINSGEVNKPFIVSAENYITESGLKNSSAKVFTKNTILMAMYGATAGKVSFIDFEAATNQAICAINPLDSTFNIYLKICLERLYEYLVNISSGSARDNLSQDKINNLEIIVPDYLILKKFDEFAIPLMNTILNNLKENNSLASLRDWLLPMFMNGQVTVQLQNDDLGKDRSCDLTK